MNEKVWARACGLLYKAAFEFIVVEVKLKASFLYEGVPFEDFKPTHKR